MKLGTRASTLAMTQSAWVADRLRCLGHDVELVPVRTRGDRERESLRELAGLGVFAAELRAALLRGDVDFAVHSLKDLPVASVPGLVIAALPERESPWDALCARDGLRLAELPVGARVGTGSPRRVAQLRRARPDLEYVDIRGNIDTRLARVASGDLDAVVLAAAGLRRLGLAGRITEELRLLPAPGQGALAIECRSDDAATRAVLAPLDDPEARLAVTEERALLAALGGGCAAPIAALAATNLEAGVFSPDGAREARTSLPLRPGAGEQAAAQLMAAGAAEAAVLDASRASRLAEFHDDASLWPSDVRRTVFLPREPGKLSNALETGGLAVTACPVQQRRVTVKAIEPGPADWSVVTSARTVATVVELGTRLPGRIAAVGKATAAALKQAGYKVDFLPRLESAEGLLAEFPAGPGQVFLPCSALAPNTLAEGLRGRGWEVARADVYTMEPMAIPAEVAARWRDGEYAAVVVTSGSVARVLDGALGWPQGTRVLAIGQSTARVLNDLGVAASVSPSPRPEAVAASAVELVRKGNA